MHHTVLNYKMINRAHRILMVQPQEHQLCLTWSEVDEQGEYMLLTKLGLPDVDQHICIGAVAHRQVIIMSTIVVLYGFFLGAP